MDSRTKPDRLSTLPDCILILIISFLPFKEAVRTQILSKHWRNLCHYTTNIAFNESDFVNLFESNEETKRVKRVSFIRFVTQWVSRFSGEVIESFHLYISKPVGFEEEIKSVIEFAVSRQVKNLILDFSDPNWRTCEEASKRKPVFQLPETVYGLKTLESLKLYACGFNPSKFVKQDSLQSLSFGWIQLRNLMALVLAKCPLLESLSIKNCWNVDLDVITGDENRLKVLVFKNCEFIVPYTTLDLPNIEIFKYSGEVHYFEFLRVNRIMKEVNLDFGVETESNEATGLLFSSLLYNLLSARTLTICPFLIQVIEDGDDPIRLQEPMETRHLVMKTNLHPNEFIGIRLMINSCPDLESLTFQIVPPRLISKELTDIDRIDPVKYWEQKITHKCLMKTLKVVEVKNFSGGTYELHVLRFLIRYGRVLERVDLYMPSGLEESQREIVVASAKLVGESFERGSRYLRIRLFQ